MSKKEESDYINSIRLVAKGDAAYIEELMMHEFDFEQALAMFMIKNSGQQNSEE